MLLRLTIVRKIDAGDGSYPSVNTCVHYLKVTILLETTFNLKSGQASHDFMFPASRLFKRECPAREAVGCNCRERIPPELRVFHCKENCFNGTGNESAWISLKLRMLEWFPGNEVGCTVFCFLEVFRCSSMSNLQNVALLWLMKVFGSNSIGNTLFTLNVLTSAKPSLIVLTQWLDTTAQLN